VHSGKCSTALPHHSVVDAGIDDEMCDVDILGPARGGRLGHSPQAELALANAIALPPRNVPSRR